MDPSKDAQDYATNATAEIQKCIERTQQRVAAAQKDVLQLVEEQQIAIPAQPSAPVPHPEGEPIGDPQGQTEMPVAQTQLTEIINLIAQQSGVQMVVTDQQAEAATAAAIKIFDEVAQIFTHMSAPLLTEPVGDGRDVMPSAGMPVSDGLRPDMLCEQDLASEFGA